MKGFPNGAEAHRPKKKNDSCAPWRENLRKMTIDYDGKSLRS
jgi:hypothetical protein